MNEIILSPEEQALAARLMLIWTPPGCTVKFEGERKAKQPDFFLTFNNGTYFRYTTYAGDLQRFVFSSSKGLGEGCLSLFIFDGNLLRNYSFVEDGALRNASFLEDGSRDEQKRFADQWLDFFRRSCFLSGCNIECTAHEREQWVHSLSTTQPSDAAQQNLIQQIVQELTDRYAELEIP